MQRTNAPMLVAMACGVLCLLGASAAWASGREFRVAVETVELRAEPNAEATVVAELQRGDKVVEFARRGDWRKIGVYRAVGLEGWVQSAALAAIPRRRTPAPPAPAAIKVAVPFELSVGGSPARKFRGTCRLLNTAQAIETVAFEGITPSKFDIEAEAASCRVQKWDARGRLRVNLMRGNKTVATAETAAAFNWVRVRSDGPWGRQGGRRGLVRTPILTKRGGARPTNSPTIPPL